MRDIVKYSVPYSVPSCLIDGGCRFTLIGMMCLAQDLAAGHYGSRGLSIPHLQKKGFTWVITKQRFEIDEYPLWLDELELQTWAKPPKGPFCFRDYAYSYRSGGKKATLDDALDSAAKNASDVHSAADAGGAYNAFSAAAAGGAPAKPFFRGTSNWMILDNAFKPVKPDASNMGGLSYCADDSLESVFPKIPCPDTWDIEQHFSPTVIDIDLNNHVNNLQYVRWILSWVSEDVHRNRLVSSLETYFISSAMMGDELICRSAVCRKDAGAESVSGAAASSETVECVHSIIRKYDGSEVFRARTVWKDAALMSRPAAVR